MITTPPQPVRTATFLLLAAGLLAGVTAVVPVGRAASWPQYHGPNADNTTSEKIPLGRWPKDGPKVQWKTETTDGFSSFAVAGGRAFTLFTEDIDGVPMEVCVAFDVDSGERLWSSPLTAAVYGHGGGDSGEPGNKGGDGPRSTPSVVGGKVYTIDSNIKLKCFDAKDGEILWSRDILNDHNGKNIKWKNAASPLIEDGRIFLAGGGRGEALLAVDKDTGKTLWAAQDDTMTHATPVAATVHGVRQVIFFTTSGLVAVKPDDGELLWRTSFPFSVSTAASPVVYEDIVYCSAGYSVGGGAFRIKKSGSGFSAEELWRTPKENMNHWSTPVVKDGYLYGMFSFKEYGKGPVACVDIRTGEMQWKEPGFGPGNVIMAGDHLVALSDRGKVTVIAANPEGYRALKSTDAVGGKCWSTPVLSDGRLFVRSTKEAVCLNLTR